MLRYFTPNYAPAILGNEPYCRDSEHQHNVQMTECPNIHKQALGVDDLAKKYCDFFQAGSRCTILSGFFSMLVSKITLRVSRQSNQTNVPV